jgi:hypothetical protein
MITLSPQYYLTIIDSLITVHEEIGEIKPSPALKEKIHSLLAHKNSCMAQVKDGKTLQLPRLMDSLVTHLREMSAGGAFVYEAVARVGHAALTERSRLVWKMDFEHSILRAINEPPESDVLYGYFGAIHAQLYPKTGDELDELYGRVAALGEDTMLPRLLGDRAALLVRSVHVLAREILLTKVAEVKEEKAPQLVASEEVTRILLSGKQLQLWDLIAIRHHGKDLSELKLTIDADTATVIGLLKYLPNLKLLDLTGCVRVTAEAFKGGHQSLEKIILNHTGITPDSINRALFPKLVEVEKQSPYVVFDMPPIPCFDEETLRKIEEADKIVTRSGVNDNNFKIFAARATEQNWRGFKVWFNAVIDGKFESDNEHLFGLISDRMHEFWANACEFPSTLPCAEVALNDVKNWITNTEKRVPRARVNQLFDSYLRQARKMLVVTVENGEVKWSANRFAAARNFLKQRPLFKASFIEFLCRDLCEILETIKVPNLKTKHEVDEAAQDRIAACVEYITEVFMECLQVCGSVNLETAVLHYLKCYTSNPTGSIMGFMFGRSATALQQFVYTKTIDQVLACAFASRIDSTEKREELLQHILTQVNGLQSDGYYPLARLVSGTLSENDVPFFEVDGLLARRLSAYRGVFNEVNISPALKKVYFDALITGHLGGKNRVLLMVLEAMYQDTATPTSWKKKITIALRTMTSTRSLLTGAYYQYETTDTFIIAARKLLESLKPC